MATGNDAKRCECHGEPMCWARDHRYRAGGFWRCRVRHAATQRGVYANLDGIRYSRMLLKHRRQKGLARMARRHDSGGLNGAVSHQG